MPHSTLGHWQLAHTRHKAYIQQSRRCYYCNLLMWEKSPERFAAQYRIPLALTHNLRCTAEHLKARCEGGSNHPKNIVAACWLCNQKRHHMPQPLEPEPYQRHVRACMAQGQWQPAPLVKALVSPQTLA